MNETAPTLARSLLRLTLALALVLGPGSEQRAAAEWRDAAPPRGLESLSLEELLDIVVRPWDALRARRTLALEGEVAACLSAATLGDVLEMVGLATARGPFGRGLVMAPPPHGAHVARVVVDGEPAGLGGVVPARLLRLPVERVVRVDLLLEPGPGRDAVRVHVTTRGEEAP